MKVRLQKNLFDRARAMGSTEEYARALGDHEGRVVKATREFKGRTGLVYAYNVRLSGKIYHVAALYADVVEEGSP